MIPTTWHASRGLFGDFAIGKFCEGSDCEAACWFSRMVKLMWLRGKQPLLCRPPVSPAHSPEAGLVFWNADRFGSSYANQAVSFMVPKVPYGTAAVLVILRSHDCAPVHSRERLGTDDSCPYQWAYSLIALNYSARPPARPSTSSSYTSRAAIMACGPLRIDRPSGLCRPFPPF